MQCSIKISKILVTVYYIHCWIVVVYQESQVISQQLWCMTCIVVIFKSFWVNIQVCMGLWQCYSIHVSLTTVCKTVKHHPTTNLSQHTWTYQTYLHVQLSCHDVILLMKATKGFLTICWFWWNTNRKWLPWKSVS